MQTKFFHDLVVLMKTDAFILTAGLAIMVVLLIVLT